MAQVFERSGVWYTRFMHNKKDYFRSTGVAVPIEGKKAVEESKATSMAELDRMLAEVRGGESVAALFARLIEAIVYLPACISFLRLLNRSHLPIASAMSRDWPRWLPPPSRMTILPPSRP